MSDMNSNASSISFVYGVDDISDAGTSIRSITGPSSSALHSVTAAPLSSCDSKSVNILVTFCVYLVRSGSFPSFERVASSSSSNWPRSVSRRSACFSSRRICLLTGRSSRPVRSYIASFWSFNALSIAWVFYYSSMFKTGRVSAATVELVWLLEYAASADLETNFSIWSISLRSALSIDGKNERIRYEAYSFLPLLGIVFRNSLTMLYRSTVS